MTIPGTVLLRCDADPDRGTGHVMRCLGIAQTLSGYGVDSSFACSSLSPEIEHRIRESPSELRWIRSDPGSIDDARETGQEADEVSADWIILDGYHFDTRFQRELRKLDPASIYLDDFGHLPSYPSDVLVNQNMYAHEIDYGERFEGSLMIQGPRFAILREEFLQAKGPPRSVPDAAKHVLISFGGFQREEALIKVVEALDRVETELHIRIVGSRPDVAESPEDLHRANHRYEFLGPVDRMAEEMMWADLALSAGGTTILELLFMGVPTVGFALAENQRRVVEAIDDRELGLGLGWLEDLDSRRVGDRIDQLVHAPEERKEMSKRSQDLVEGLGAERVAAEVLGHRLLLRSTQHRDMERIWHWANDPAVREASFSPEKIEWEEHVRWFSERLEDPSTQLWIATDLDGRPVGQVRFEKRVEGGSEISVSLKEDRRGEGLGVHLIDIASRRFLNQTHHGSVHAYIRKDNPRSAKTFESAGYEKVKETEVDGVPAFHHVRGAEA